MMTLSKLDKVSHLCRSPFIGYIPQASHDVADIALALLEKTDETSMPLAFSSRATLGGMFSSM